MAKTCLMLNDSLLKLYQELRDNGLFENWSKSKALNYLIYLGMRKIIELNNPIDKVELLRKVDDEASGFTF